jgi:hypothetical protein
MALDGYDEKFWIILGGQVSVQYPSNFMRDQSMGSSAIGMIWPPPVADSASVQKSFVIKTLI